MEDGRILAVSEEGVIAEIKETAGEEAPEAEEEVEMEAEESATPKKIVESTSVETHFSEEEATQEVVEEQLAEEEAPMEDKIKAIVMPLIEEMKAELSAIREEMGYQKEEMSKKEEEVELMKAELSEQSAAKPIKHNPENAQNEKVRMATNRRPMTSLDRVMSKLNK